MKVVINILMFLLIINDTFLAQSNLLNSGPLVGYSKMTEVCIWFQTKEKSDVKIKYWEKEQPQKILTTDRIVTKKENAFTGKLIIEKLSPGKEYYFDIYINGEKQEFAYQPKFQTQTLWQWRTDPPEFKFAAGSCAFINETQVDRPGKAYGGDYQIFNSIADMNPDFMLWLGDNVYLREVDWDSWSGIIHRYSHDRATPELQKLFATTHNYAIWDDHDFGTNNSDRGLWNKNMTLKAFEMFWPNPSFGVNNLPGITTYFEWADCAFFLMDDRYFRTPDNRKTGKRELLGKEQIEWLIDALVSSKASFKFVAIGTQVLNENASGENYSSFHEEREYLLNIIQKENIPGVIFLSGDIHRTELLKLERENDYPLYEFTISPLTSGVSNYRDSLNNLLVEGTLTYKRNYGIFEITGGKKNRILKFTDFDSDGNELWHYEIKASDLRRKIQKK